MRLPARQFPCFYCKAHMNRPGSIVWWNCSAWKLGGFLGCAADKKQQHVPGGNIERTEAIIFDQGFEPHHLFIKRLCSLKIIDVQTCLFQVSQLRHHRF